MEQLNGVKILVVEDNILNQKIVNIILHKLGAEIGTAANGQEAIAQLVSKNFDIVLMDLNMPVMDGYETSKYIRCNLNSNIPIIALTADNIAQDDKDLVAVGINAGISKPFEIDYFCSLVLKLIKDSVK